jgi:hypothetical protein
VEILATPAMEAQLQESVSDVVPLTKETDIAVVRGLLNEILAPFGRSFTINIKTLLLERLFWQKFPTIPDYAFRLIIYLAAMISCGIPMSAVEWSERNLWPVLVEVQGKEYLAMAPISVRSESDYDFYLLQAFNGQSSGVDYDSKRWTLVARKKSAESDIGILCLLPPELKVASGWRERLFG